MPASSEVIVTGDVVDAPTGFSWGILEPMAISVHSDLLVGKTLVDLRGTGVPVRMMNLSNQPKQIKQGFELAKCTPVTSVASHPKKHQQSGNCTVLPNYMKALYYKSVSNLECQQQQVHDLLCQNANVFSQSAHDLGHTDLVKHHVNTGAVAPIRQPPR